MRRLLLGSVFLGNLTMAFASVAHAQGAAGAPEAPNPFFMFVLVMAVMFFFMIRPQIKRNREMQDMINSIAKGDKIITTGGLAGVVKKVDDASDLVEVEIASGVVVQILRSMIANKVGDDSPLKDKIGKIKSSGTKASDKKSTGKKTSAKNTKKSPAKKETAEDDESKAA